MLAGGEVFPAETATGAERDVEGGTADPGNCREQPSKSIEHEDGRRAAEGPGQVGLDLV